MATVTSQKYEKKPIPSPFRRRRLALKTTKGEFLLTYAKRGIGSVLKKRLSTTETKDTVPKESVSITATGEEKGEMLLYIFRKSTFRRQDMLSIDATVPPIGTTTRKDSGHRRSRMGNLPRSDRQSPKIGKPGRMVSNAEDSLPPPSHWGHATLPPYQDAGGRSPN